MNEVYKVKNVEEILEYMEEGYIFTLDHILAFFNIKKTQYYEYISNNVSKVKVPAAVRRELKETDIENEYLQFFINHIILTESSVLLKFEEVFYYMIIKGYFKVELFNTEDKTYEDVTTEYILSEDDESVENTLKLLERALAKSLKWQDFDEEFINSGKGPTNSQKTLQSRFYSRISTFNHFRFRVLGVYCYAIIEDIDENIPEFLMIKRDGYKFIKKFRNA